MEQTRNLHSCRYVTSYYLAGTKMANENTFIYSALDSQQGQAPRIGGESHRCAQEDLGADILFGYLAV